MNYVSIGCINGCIDAYLFLRYYSESDESTYSIRKMAIMFWKCLESNHKMQCRSGTPGKINISFFNLWCAIVNLAATTKSEDFSFWFFLFYFFFKSQNHDERKKLLKIYIHTLFAYSKKYSITHLSNYPVKN